MHSVGWALAAWASLVFPAQPSLKVQEPVVAGQFYPAGQGELSAQVDALLAEAQVVPLPRLRALVCPHAGYPFSGATAAWGYRQAAGRDVRRVVVLGPSHYAVFKGAAVPGADAWRTPLGTVTISPEVRTWGGPFQVDPPCRVYPPEWARGTGLATPFTFEHSVEVQLPFLQKVLPGVPVAPVLLGDVDPEAVARALEPRLDDRTLVIASSDLSHFHPYEEARRLDAACVKAICALDLEAMARQEACGKGPILALMRLARRRGWQARLLDQRNSGDQGAGKASVVGYAAIAFFEPVPAAKHAMAAKEEALAPGERAFLLDLARRSLGAATRGEPPPAVDPASLGPRLLEKRGCFVTLTRGDELRGCIGFIQPVEPLWRAVLDNARNAALEDPRFSRVKPAEGAKLRIEISVLTVPRPLAFSSTADLLRRLRPGVDGVILRRGPLQATFLPQVWDQLPDRVSFLKELSLKAGGPGELWREPGVEVSVYQVEAFKEPGP